MPCQICQESARGRSLPVAIAVRSWLQRVIIGEGLGGLGFISLGTVGTLLVCCGEFQQQECGASLKFKDVHTWLLKMRLMVWRFVPLGGSGYDLGCPSSGLPSRKRWRGHGDVSTPECTERSSPLIIITISPSPQSAPLSSPLEYPTVFSFRSMEHIEHI